MWFAALLPAFSIKDAAFEMGLAGSGLVRPPPKRPSDDVGGPDAPLRQPHRDAADFLDRPADQWARGLGRAGLFGGGGLAWWRITASRAKASITRVTCRCQPCQERVSL